MILDLEKLTDLHDRRLACDVCIIGGGAVGLALATTLSEAGASVLVLEGGGTGLESASQALLLAESIGHPLTYLNSRYRVLGGTTTYWGGQVYPFDGFVTGARPWLGHEAWPVPSSEMQMWFDQAYRLLGLSSALLEDSAVWQAADQELPDLGPDLEMVTTRWVKTRNFSRLFASPLRRANGPRVLTHANVTALRIAQGSTRVAAAVVRTLNGRETEVRANRFVLANGTLELTRLLLQPLADGANPPWADSPWIGVPLIDHLDCRAADVHILDHERFHDLFDNIFLDGFKYYPKLRLTPSTQQREGLVDIAAQFHYHTRLTEHIENLKMFFRSIGEGTAGAKVSELPRHLRGVAATAFPLALRYIRDNRSFKPRDAAVSLMLYTEQLPAPRSRVFLGVEQDALGMRRLKVDWQIDGRELETMRRFTRIIKRDLERLGLAKVVPDPELEAGSPAFFAKVHDAVHQMGTARIGADRHQGVVDHDLKVFDTDNLYVAGAAVFPSTGFANPTFTAVALARRLAAHLTATSAR